MNHSKGCPSADTYKAEVPCVCLYDEIGQIEFIRASGQLDVTPEQVIELNKVLDLQNESIWKGLAPCRKTTTKEQ